MTRRPSTPSLIFAWTMLATVVGLAAWLVLSPLLSPGRPTAADLARGEALIRSRYADTRTRVGRVRLAPAGRCAMHGNVELVDTGSSGATRQADCLVMISRDDAFTVTCRPAR